MSVANASQIYFDSGPQRAEINYNMVVYEQTQFKYT